jgi:ABC-type sugar transport system permease subunit
VWSDLSRLQARRQWRGVDDTERWASSRGHLKTISTLFIAPLVMGVAIAVLALTSIGHEDYGVLQWSLAILAALLAGLIVGAILNFAIFAPVYWLLGRLHSKKTQTETKLSDDT